MKFKSYVHRISKDKDGELTIVLKVSATEAREAFYIPTDAVLDVEIRPEAH